MLNLLNSIEFCQTNDTEESSGIPKFRLLDLECLVTIYFLSFVTFKNTKCRWWSCTISCTVRFSLQRTIFHGSGYITDPLIRLPGPSKGKEELSNLKNTCVRRVGNKLLINFFYLECFNLFTSKMSLWQGLRWRCSIQRFNFILYIYLYFTCLLDHSSFLILSE